MANSINWNWTEFCPTGLTPWIEDSSDLASCFQEICLQFPVYVIFATFSSFHFGKHGNSVVRNSTQIMMIRFRIGFAIILALIPIIFYLLEQNVTFYPVDILMCCVKAITWIIHAGFLISFLKCGSINHRGPLSINILWVTIFALELIAFRTNIKSSYWPFNTITVIVNGTYLLTLIPSGNATYATSTINDNEERRTLLANRYTYFNFNFNEMNLGHAQDEANFLSRIFFYWVNPLITKGINGNLKTIEDLFDLPECLNIRKISESLHVALNQRKELFWALHKTFGKEFYLIGLIRFIGDTSGFAGPLLLGGLLKQQNSQMGPYVYAVGLLISTLISAFCGTHFNWRMTIVGMKMRIGVVNAIYYKALAARGLNDARPDILNLMSTDTDRIVNSCISFHSFWSIPFQLFTTLYLLYTQIGSAFIAGVLFAAALIPINRWISVKIAKLSQSLMTCKDARVAATNEIISGAKHIKLHAWEDIFINKLLALRKNEIKYLSKRKYMDAICVYFWATTPILMCLLTFGISTIMGNPLTAATTYTSVALLNMLIGPLNAFPWVLNGLIEAWVSVKRVQELLNLQNLDLTTYYGTFNNKQFENIDSKESVLLINNGTFEYETKISKREADFVFKLKNINIDVKKGDLVCIEGPVGSGKSALLSAIVASIKCCSGSICVDDISCGFGYVSESPWLQRGTIRENVTWGMLFDEQRYKQVLQACALIQDLEDLGGDHKGIGENGRTLSGGQRIRLSLARAVYQNKEIYLLDNILVSLDAHVANHIVKHCILGLLKDKTRIIVTDNKTLFFHANQCLHIENGCIIKSNFMSESFEISDEDDDDDDDKNSGISQKKPMNILEDLTDRTSVDSIMMEESREYGSLKSDVLVKYWKAVSNPISIAVIASLIFMQISRNISDAWLAHWVTETNKNTTSNNTVTWSIIDQSNSTYSLGYYLGIYSFLAVTNSLFTLIRAFLFAYAGIRAAIYIHNTLLNTVLYTKFQFFDITSVGRILNRFSSDTYTIDDTLPFILNILLAQSFGLAGAVCVSLYAMPWLGIILIPLCPIYISLQYRYRHASRDIKRLSCNALSPLYTHFTETLNGLITIRAMRANQRFHRDFQVKLEESIKSQVTSSAAQQWLALRLQILGSLLVGGSGILAAVSSYHNTNPGMVGLAISYTFSITSLLGGLLNALAETEQEMVAVERVNQYLELGKENNFDGVIEVPFGWPSQGVISFENVSLKYREYLTPAIHNFSITTNAYERIGIVGRTGAGKSSIFAALMRIAPLEEGKISIDCVDLKTLCLKTLRDRIAIIPQEPFLFEGSLRENLDPRNEYMDSEIWSAITNCLATPLVQGLGGLHGVLEKGGANLSAGQKQLLCLTRALLKNAKVVLIDEGTANLDSDSEAAIHIVLRNAFKRSTVLLIAHRLKSLQCVDRIIVIGNGMIIEEVRPEQLSEDNNSVFSKMLQEQSLL